MRGCLFVIAVAVAVFILPLIAAVIGIFGNTGSNI